MYVALNDRVQVPIRFPADQNGRLKREAAARGQTVQAYVHAAVIEKLENDEQERAQAKDRRKKKETDPWRGSEPMGLGLNLRPSVQVAESEPEPYAPPAPVVVQVNNVKTANECADMLAGWIVAGEEYERRGRTKLAGEIIDSGCPADQRATVRREMDEALTKKTETKQETGLSRFFSWKGIVG